MKTRIPKIICIARNYLDHCRELGNAVPMSPTFFLKSHNCMVLPPNTIRLDKERTMTSDGIHYEMELALHIKEDAKHISVDDALCHVDGIYMALDLTDRGAQKNEKSAGYSWTVSKCQDCFLPMSDKLIPLHEIDLSSTKFWLNINGETRQKGNTNQMIQGMAKIVSSASEIMTLIEDDIILTGTPAGVGRLNIGDKLEMGVELKNGDQEICCFEIESS